MPEYLRNLNCCGCASYELADVQCIYCNDGTTATYYCIEIDGQVVILAKQPFDFCTLNSEDSYTIFGNSFGPTEIFGLVGYVGSSPPSFTHTEISFGSSPSDVVYRLFAGTSDCLATRELTKISQALSGDWPSSILVSPCLP